MHTYFNTSYSVIQETITVYLTGLAIFQLFYGPISDHFGRKKTLLSGLLLYIVASLICVLSINVTMLLIARFFQAIGACAGLVMGRCMISDVSDKQGSARIFSIVLPIVAMSPAIAPVIGGYLQVVLGWRAVLSFSVVFGVALFIIVKLKIGETLAGQSKKSFHPMQIIRNNVALLNCLKFVAHTLIVGAVYCSWFAYLSDSSDIYKTFALAPEQVGFCYISQSIASVIGSLSAKHIIKSLPINNMILIAIVINLLAAIFMLILGSLILWVFLFIITIAAFSNGILLPLNISSAMSSAIEYSPKLGGSASGLVGFIQIGCGALGAFLVSFLAHSVYALSTVLIGCMCVALPIIFLLLKSSVKTEVY